ncbi:MAG: protein kinase [Anaerolineaceae bacterium]|nr:protein kinase [Anaerolineaceae bacterium]
MPLHEGQAIGPYQIINQLGQGGMATVYKAYHARLDRYVAIKVMHKAFKDDSNFQARFQREAQIVARLEHANIVTVYDYNEYDGEPYLVMKYVEGKTLKRILNEGAPSLREVLHIVSSVGDALDYAHQHGVLHRDVKPSNIIVDANDSVYLTDFGLARIAGAGESTMSQDMILGTPQYISPEQAKGLGNVDSRTDIYSFGIVLYELVVGRVPFNADTPFAVVHDHIYSRLPLPSAANPEIPPEVERVLLKALAKNPDDRYSSAKEMADAFRAAVVESGLQTLSAERSQIAEASLAKLRSEMDNSPTVIGDEPTGIQVSVSPPRPPVPPAPPRAPIVMKKGAKVEHEFDIGDLDLGEWKQKLGSGAKQGVGIIGEIVTSVQEAIKEREENITPEEKIRRKIKKRQEERQGFIIHLVIYLGINLMFWAMWLTNSSGDFPWPAFISIPWGVGMLAHWMEYNNKYGPGAERREREIEMEVEREMRRQYEGDYLAKPKRDHRVRLTEDGELEEIWDEADDLEQKRGGR